VTSKAKSSRSFDKPDWINLLEIRKYMTYVIWISQMEGYAHDFKLLGKRITTLVKTNGFDFTFHYLKECHRLVVQYLAGSPNLLSLGKNRVKVNRYGLPVIIPSSLRVLLCTAGENVVITQAILTAISIYRTFRTIVKPDLGTITAPFSGLSRTLEMGSVVKDFVGKFDISFGSIKGFISESSGPICKRATIGCGIDAIALFLYPKVAYSVARLLISRKAYLYLLSLIGIWITGVPMYVLLIVCGLQKRLPIGRLCVVTDQAGKARIVAIVNWWVQLSLLGLHKSIFRFLETIEEDGTFNQTAPLDKLRANRLDGHYYYSFDLSAATDRLPVDLQIQILNSLGVNGNLWRNILDFPYSYKGEDVKYSVGQPMGAYSSWAMLALTHHILVKYAAKLAGVGQFTNYAVLGDDLVINHNQVADQYRLIMSTLGVGINPSKSVISYEVIEFAKRLVTTHDDLSPIGPGAILAVMRTPALIGSLFRELNSKSIAVAFGSVQKLIKTIPGNSRDRVYLALWTLFGINGLLSTRQPESNTLLSWITYGRSIEPSLFEYSLNTGVKHAVITRARRAIELNYLEEKFFYRKTLRDLFRIGLSKGLLDTLAFVLSPMPWIYWESLIRQTQRSIDHLDMLYNISNDHAGTIAVLNSDLPIGISYRWNKAAAKELNSLIKHIDKETWRAYDDMMIIHGADGPNFY